MRPFALVLMVLLLNAAPAPAQQPAATADDGGYAALPPLPAAAMDDAAPIRMTPDGPAVIHLNEDAASVIIGNPAQATAILENPRLIMLLPQQPGATKIIALDRRGRAILDKHVLVGGGSSQFIRVNRACGAGRGAGGACQPVSMYYCPDRCYETSVPQAGQAMGSGGAGYAPPPPPQSQNIMDEAAIMDEDPILPAPEVVE